MSYVSAEIMNACGKGVNDHKADAAKKNAKKQFDGVAKTDVLIEAAPKKQSKPTVTGQIDKLANDMREFA
jgi:hypothetical protein